MDEGMQDGRTDTASSGWSGDSAARAEGGQRNPAFATFHSRLFKGKKSLDRAIRSPHTAMPPSQLKRLKASLREQGVTGPQKSKKQKQQDRKGTTDSRVQRNAALQQIRDSFNPFEIKANNRPAKFQSLTAHPKKDAVLRPGVTRSMGEEAVSSIILHLAIKY